MIAAGHKYTGSSLVKGVEAVEDIVVVSRDHVFILEPKVEYIPEKVEPAGAVYTLQEIEEVPPLFCFIFTDTVVFEMCVGKKKDGIGQGENLRVPFDIEQGIRSMNDRYMSESNVKIKGKSFV